MQHPRAHQNGVIGQGPRDRCHKPCRGTTVNQETLTPPAFTMKIEQFSVSLASEHAYSRQTSRSETLRAWVGDQRPDFEGANRDDSAASGSARVIISAAARQALAAASAQTGGTPPQANQAEDAAPALPVDEEKIHDAKLDLLIRLVEALTGRKIKVMDAGEISKLSTAGQELADI